MLMLTHKAALHCSCQTSWTALEKTLHAPRWIEFANVKSLTSNHWRIFTWANFRAQNSSFFCSIMSKSAYIVS
jgi:hypothetical protein